MKVEIYEKKWIKDRIGFAWWWCERILSNRSYVSFKKYGLLKNVKALSGGSIGAFSMIGFLMNDLKKAYYTFKEMNSERVLGYKKV